MFYLLIYTILNVKKITSTLYLALLEKRHSLVFSCCITISDASLPKMHGAGKKVLSAW